MSSSALNIKQVVARIIIIIAIVELIIMFGFILLPEIESPATEALLDTALLSLISTPVIYLWVIRPFVIARDEAIAKLTDWAYQDPLTGLANRRLLLESLERFMSESARHKSFGALLLIDLDNFKPINDNYGHDVGDAVLIEVARRLKANVRTEDVVSRVGGDEFIILLGHLTDSSIEESHEAVQKASELQKHLNEPIEFNGNTLQVGSSFGIRILSIEVTGVESAIREADVAMYKAKKEQKGSIVTFDSINSGLT